MMIELQQTNAADLMLWLGLTFLFSGAGAFFGAYLKKKGENYATKEDISGLVQQVSAVTRATEEIKAEISSDIWDRQKRWELKREVLFEATRRVSTTFEILKKLNVILRTQPENPSEAWTQEKLAENAKWFQALAALDESILFVGVTCGKEVADTISSYRQLGAAVAAKIFNDFSPRLLN